MNLCFFLANHAEYFGSFYRMTKGSTRLSSSNVTSSAAKLVSVDVRYTVLEDSTARVHHGGFWARLLESMRITRCLFTRCRHTCDQQDVGPALLIHNNADDSGLTDNLITERIGRDLVDHYSESTLMSRWQMTANLSFPFLDKNAYINQTQLAGTPGKSKVE
jgi:hypothetical protein